MNFISRTARKLSEWLDPKETTSTSRQGSASSPGQGAPRIQVQRQYTPTYSRRPGPAIVVQRNPIPYWQERSWQQRDGEFTGAFETRHGKWAGRVSVSPSGRVEVFIQNPPGALQRHSHWQCFNDRGGGWFFIHPVTIIRDVSAAILNVEKIIAESYEL